MQIGSRVQEVMLANSKWLKNHFKGNGFKCNLVNREFVVRIFLLVRWRFIRLSHDGIALSCWSQRFDCNTASLHQAMRSIVYMSLFVAWWFAAIGAFRSSLLFRLLDVVPSQVCFVVGRLLCFLDYRYPSFRTFDSTISVDVIRMKSYMDSLFDPTCVPVRVTINKLNCMLTVSLACSETVEVCVRASRISLSCSFILSCIALPFSPIYTLPHSHGIL